jgi:hypothetical protein
MFNFSTIISYCLQFVKMNFVAAHCQRSKDLWLRMLSECEQRKSDDLVTTCYNNSESFVLLNHC